ncbi:uncharacterized protein LOC104583514 isoform X2 [Brachypodium distachyon]|uniref:uncharacterized protein LOC104583514 isoform X2 n=1 Tax=Brachypodium distachyon TaxID=15368 RepID=UPI000D0D3F1B|nr:uncharacterized protein LOC104583514 isoform X2 [Brachypodium distachyon]|eukprot:XP_024316220.1 uncharacterized protein LOC104583514 isoform X2 [Brachypodium distachyon]
MLQRRLWNKRHMRIVLSKRARKRTTMSRGKRICQWMKNTLMISCLRVIHLVFSGTDEVEHIVWIVRFVVAKSARATTTLDKEAPTKSKSTF